ncbi:MAG: Ig-like domain-containing protein [Nonlabens ulvanivorans]|uniref:Ig-like domain-containing protein n=2 Tax=Nonlabens ulvanivorans TaxID=906888 RepID=UPI003265D421
MRLNFFCRLNLELFFTIALFFSFTISALSQSQANSIRTDVTFQWLDVQANNNQPATLESITIGTEVYDIMAVPSAYELTRLGPDGHGRNEIRHGNVIINNNSSNIDWNDDALKSFQDRDLTHYFTSNHNGDDICTDFAAVATTDSQIQTLRYSPGIPSNEGGIIAITERNSNNCFYISFYGEPSGGGPEVFLGDTFVLPNTTQSGPLFNAPPVGVDYWNSGRVVHNNGTIGIAIFTLEDLAPVGSVITRVDFTASSNDHGDGKMLILQRYASSKNEEGCRNDTFNGTVKDSSSPAGSTFTVISPPDPAGESFTFSSNGDYTYTPSPGFIGDVVFEYEICLPAPNDTTCDREVVTINFQTGAACVCSSGNANAPMLGN